ncbi:hypothetical protein T05_11357 [Trichinella murrelli]|uniref:Uncharacterized protein n=1 Tax=Trichinella murrelli TaxID=144512 RepID=A0A0V0TCS6_9BILA|nr:hypothetical protein T05_11357 [Trichinella murrelli]
MSNGLELVKIVCCFDMLKASIITRRCDNVKTVANQQIQNLEADVHDQLKGYKILPHFYD